MTKKADRADQFALYLRAEKIGGWEREFMFAKEIGRRWRFDFAWPGSHIGEASHRMDQQFLHLAVEIEGVTSFGRRRSACSKCGSPIPGAMILGRHQTAKGMEEDCIKYESALNLGWIVYRVTQNHMADPVVFTTIRSLIGDQPGPVPPEQEGIELLPTSEF